MSTETTNDDRIGDLLIRAMIHPDRQERRDWETCTLLDILNGLEDTAVDAENAGKPLDDACRAMNTLVSEIALIVEEMAWSWTRDDWGDVLRVAFWPNASELVARYIELTETRHLDWWRTNPTLLLAIRSITQAYWADWKRTNDVDEDAG